MGPGERNIGGLGSFWVGFAYCSRGIRCVLCGQWVGGLEIGGLRFEVELFEGERRYL